jgi:hypothetical protein
MPRLGLGAEVPPYGLRPSSFVALFGGGRGTGVRWPVGGGILQRFGDGDGGNWQNGPKGSAWTMPTYTIPVQQ